MGGLPNEMKVSQNDVRRVYSMSITGIYKTELLDNIVAKFIGVLNTIKTQPVSESEKARCINLINSLKKSLKSNDDNQKMMAIDHVIHTAHVSGFYAAHLIKGGKTIMSFLDSLAEIKKDDFWTQLKKQLTDYNDTITSRSLYGTITYCGFEEFNKNAIRDTEARFKSMGLTQESILKNCTILDVGCNLGHMMFEANKYTPKICWGIENDSSKINLGNQIAKHLRVQEKVKFVNTNVDQLNIEILKSLTGLNEFDIVFCFAIDGHLKNPAKFYKFLSQITKKQLFFESNNHSRTWTLNVFKSLGFTHMKSIIVPYDMQEGTTRKCYLCYKDK